jgi:YhcH/YjgK/YiaL family protein
MIIDLLANSHLYQALSPALERAFDYLHQTDLVTLELGDYELDGKDLYARVLQYSTRLPEQGKWEAHRRYLDLQYMVQGVEQVCYAPVSCLTPGEYDAKKDVLQLSGQGDLITLPSGSFMLLMPTDGHMPCLAVDTPETIKKVVLKIAV